MNSNPVRQTAASGSQLAALLPTLALCVLGVFFAFEAKTPVVALGRSLVLTDVEFLIVLVTAVWALGLLKGRRRPETPQMVVVPALAWCAALAASTASAPEEYAQALRFTARMIVGVLIFWISYDTVVHSKRPTLIASSLAVGGGLVAVFGLVEALNIPGSADLLASFKFAPTRVGDMLRVSSTLGYATITAMVLELTFPLLLAWFISTNHTVIKVLTGALGLSCLAVLVLTLSRAGVIALGAALAVVICAATITRQRGILIAAAGATGALVVFAIFGLLYDPAVGLRITSENDHSWYDAAISAPPNVTSAPGQKLLVPVTISNTGQKAWTIDPVHPFSLGYHLNRPDSSVVTYDGARTPLSREIAPGESIQVDAVVFAPANQGTYVAQWDVVQNGITWFSWKGSKTTFMSLVVSGDAQTNDDIRYVPPPQELNTLPVPGRLQLWSAGLAMFIKHPILGIGPDNFRLLYGPYIGLVNWNRDIHANNLYVEFLSDTGMVGLVVYLWLAWRIMSQAWNGLRGHRLGSLWVWRIAALASLTAWFVHGLLDYFYEFTPTYVAFWMIAGIAVGLAALDLNSYRKIGVNADRI